MFNFFKKKPVIDYAKLAEMIKRNAADVGMQIMQRKREAIESRSIIGFLQAEFDYYEKDIQDDISEKSSDILHMGSNMVKLQEELERYQSNAKPKLQDPWPIDDITLQKIAALIDKKKIIDEKALTYIDNYAEDIQDEFHKLLLDDVGDYAEKHDWVENAQDADWSRYELTSLTYDRDNLHYSIVFLKKYFPQVLSGDVLEKIRRIDVEMQQSLLNNPSVYEQREVAYEPTTNWWWFMYDLKSLSANDLETL